jgi:formylglycine-generating enzyme required for sulfatase activity
MRFVPVPIIGGPTEGKTVLFSIWETRVGDFRAFVKAAKAYRYESTTGYTWDKPVVFEQTDAHPVTLVNWEDAQAFCKWLTDTERAAGKIGKNDTYRLPTDHEWSCAAGIGDREDPTADPSAKRGKIPGFVWGHQWPPGKEVANLASEEVKKLSSNSEVIPGYSDRFAFTAPVGSYPASDTGLFDLAGNVAEWCADPPRKNLPPTSNSAKFRVTRGGNWSERRMELLLASYRGDTPMDARSHGTGFRVVLALAEPEAPGEGE